MRRIIAFALTLAFGASLVGVVPAAAADTAASCSASYWKQASHFGKWQAPFDPNDKFNSVFQHSGWPEGFQRARFENAFPGKTLIQVLRQKGGGLKAFGRQTVAALLNAAYFVEAEGYNFNVPLWPGETVSDPWEVVKKFNQKHPNTTGEYNRLASKWQAANNRGCPLPYVYAFSGQSKFMSRTFNERSPAKTRLAVSVKKKAGSGNRCWARVTVKKGGHASKSTYVSETSQAWSPYDAKVIEWPNLTKRTTITVKTNGRCKYRVRAT